MWNFTSDKYVHVMLIFNQGLLIGFWVYRTWSYFLSTIIWMQVCNQILFCVKKLYMKVGLPPQNGQLENQFHIHQSHSLSRQCAKDGHISGVGRPHLCGPTTTTVLKISPGSHLQKMSLWFYQSGIDRSHSGAIQPPGLHQPTWDSF